MKNQMIKLTIKHWFRFAIWCFVGIQNECWKERVIASYSNWIISHDIYGINLSDQLRYSIPYYCYVELISCCFVTWE